jgi:hypothetical protein
MAEGIQTKSKTQSGRGGARKGAGRKVGSATKKTREIAERAMQDGITPLEFMLQIMRTEPSDAIEDRRILQSIIEMRFEAAKAAAPYMHPRLSSVEMTAEVTTHEASLDDLA